MSNKKLTVFILTVVLLFATAGKAKAEIEFKYFGVKRGRIAFTYIEGKNRDIYVIDFQKLTATPLVTTPAVDEYPRWSPDGNSLVFYSDSSGDREIYSIKADGSEMTNLTNSPGIDEDPDWAPSGKLIVFQSARSGEGNKLFVMRADGSNPSQLTNTKKKNTVPRWSPRGNEIIYSSNEYWPGWDLILYNLKTKKKTHLTSGYKSFSRPSWSPDGGSFVFSYGTKETIDIWSQKKGDKAPQQLVARAGREYDATWDETAARLFFVGELTPGKGDYQLFVLEVESQEIHQITASSGSIRHISYTPLPALSTLEEKTSKNKPSENKTF